MSRLMSVAFTEAAVRERRKTVTRRKGWLMLKPGDTLTLCRKVMGRKQGEPLVRIAEVEVVSVRRERLAHVDVAGELEREGCGHMGATEFIAAYFEPQGIHALDNVTRIEWRYLSRPSAACKPSRSLRPREQAEARAVLVRALAAKGIRQIEQHLKEVAG